MITAKAYIRYRLDSFSFLVLIFNSVHVKFPYKFSGFSFAFCNGRMYKQCKDDNYIYIYIYMYRS